MPSFVNGLLQNRLLGPALKSCAGIAQERQMPRFAHETFTAWFRRRPAPRMDGQRILLWPDTFNNYFRPQTAIAAVRVLEAAGFSVSIPAQPFCCGRPLYDWGWLGAAKRLWQHTFATLRSEIEAGIPLIGLEPACLTAFKDELMNLFPDDPLAQRLSRQSVYFSDFVAGHCSTLRFDGNGTNALVHFHCHHHAVIKSAGELGLLKNIGITHDVIPSGCCGMAGAFGFESDKFATSMRIGERVLLPRVRGAAQETLIVADGFSCREQIEQATGRHTLHAAELALRCLAH
jgi:Fe-S oxidoreductase